MQVVHTEHHRVHAPSVETYLGVPLPANEVPARVDLILAATRAADGGFTVVEPTGHGVAPIHAVHDPGLVRFLEEAWGRYSASRSTATSWSRTPTRRAGCSRG